MALYKSITLRLLVLFFIVTEQTKHNYGLKSVTIKVKLNFLLFFEAPHTTHVPNGKVAILIADRAHS
jgi:hypothetical protein